MIYVTLYIASIQSASMLRDVCNILEMHYCENLKDLVHQMIVLNCLIDLVAVGPQ